MLANFLLCNRPDPTEWHLAERVVPQLFQLWSTPKVNLFASPWNHHLTLWFCRTGHPLAEASDALSQRWTGLSPLCFSPDPIPREEVVKIREHQAQEVIITSSWPRRS